MDGRKNIVTYNIITIRESLKNDIDLYISWTPSISKSDKKAIFKIIFIDKKIVTIKISTNRAFM